MVTVTIMARASYSGFRPNRILILAAAIMPLLPAYLSAATTEVKPSIETRAYSVRTRDQQIDAELDKFLAAYLKPGLAINLTGSQASSALYLQKESVWYDDSERSNKSLDTVNWRGLVSGYDDRIHLGLNANSAHRVRDSRTGIFADIISGSDRLSKTSSYGTDLTLQTAPTADVNARVGLGYSIIRSEQPEQDDSFGDIDNKLLNAFMALGSERRQSTLFWQLSGNYSQTKRDARGDFESKSVAATTGLPVAPGLSLILRSSYYENDNASGYANDFTSYGAGLEYQFGRASRINITQNRSSRSVGQEPQRNVKDTYLAAEVFLAPSRRTSLSYSLDRRYYGRSADLQAQYRLRFITVRISLSEDVQTLTRFDQIIEELGVFVCPDGAASFSDCFRPPDSNYQLDTGESFQQLTNTEFELNESVVKRRTAAMTLGYSKQRLAVNVTVARSEYEYIETERLDERDSLSAQATWQLSSQAKLLLNGSYYDINYLSDQRADKNLSLEFGLQRKLNQHSDVNLMFRRISRHSSDDSFDLEENRVWLGYTIRL
jgi:uncharacterized protein (PEP-CTERM system associated)